MRPAKLVFPTVTASAMLALGLAGCADMQPNGPGPLMGGAYGYPPPRTAAGFIPQEFAWSVTAGPGALAGRVAYRSVAGERWTCAGQVMALIPATRYSAERMQVLYGSQARAVVPAAEVRARNAAPPDPRFSQYVRTATCDARDGFSFAHLPIGSYFLIARGRPPRHAARPNHRVVLMQRLHHRPGLPRVSLPTP